MEHQTARRGAVRRSPSALVERHVSTVLLGDIRSQHSRVLLNQVNALQSELLELKKRNAELMKNQTGSNQNDPGPSTRKPIPEHLGRQVNAFLRTRSCACARESRTLALSNILSMILHVGAGAAFGGRQGLLKDARLNIMLRLSTRKCL